MNKETLIVLASVPLLAAAGLAKTPGALLADLPLGFEPNRGQAAEEVKFLARRNRDVLLLTARGAATVGGLAIEFAGANRAPRITPADELPGKSNYLLGSNRARWRTDIPTYARVQYHDVWPGIDVVFYGSGRELEYDFLVAPGADPRSIRLAFADAPALDGGDLVLAAGARQRKPSIYQYVDGTRRRVAGSYVLAGKREVAFEVGPYDRTKPLVIDPVLAYSTYLGGSMDEDGIGIAVDAFGSAYVTGSTRSPDFPVGAGAPQATHGGGQCGFRVKLPCADVFVSKLNASGTALVYSTYLGGGDEDTGYGIAVDSSGSAYIAGFTQSTNFPVTQGAMKTSGGRGFLSKLNAAGNTLVYSTYLDGTATALALDSGGNAYVAGYALSGMATTPGAAQTAFGGGIWDAFALKMNAAGTSLVYSTYLGGSDDDQGYGIALDTAGNAYLTGQTRSPDFPATPGVVQPGKADKNSNDAFVAKLDPNGRALLYSTYLGGHDEDRAYGIAVDALGSAHIVGWTFSSNYPVTPGAFQPELRGIADAFVTKLSPSADGIVYSTYLGGREGEIGRAIALDRAGNFYVTGDTSSRNFPTTANAFSRCDPRAVFESGGAFAAMFNREGSVMTSTYLQSALGGGIAVDAAGKVYLTGSTGSEVFAITEGALKSRITGPTEAFVAKVDLAVEPPMSVACVVNGASFQPTPVAPGEIVSIFGTKLGPAEGVAARVNAAGLVGAELAGVRVFFGDIPAPLLYVSARQINAVVPYGVANQQGGTIEVEYSGTRTPAFAYTVGAASPALFALDGTGAGPGAVLNQDNTVNSPSNPAERGSIIALFGTGAGQTDPPGADGTINAPPLPKPPLKVSVSIEGKPADVIYAGGAPALVAGALQVNVRIPLDVSSPGDLPVLLKIGDVESPRLITVSVK